MNSTDAKTMNAIVDNAAMCSLRGATIGHLLNTESRNANDFNIVASSLIHSLSEDALTALIAAISVPRLCHAITGVSGHLIERVAKELAGEIDLEDWQNMHGEFKEWIAENDDKVRNDAIEAERDELSNDTSEDMEELDSALEQMHELMESIQSRIESVKQRIESTD